MVQSISWISLFWTDNLGKQAVWYVTGSWSSCSVHENLLGQDTWNGDSSIFQKGLSLLILLMLQWYALSGRVQKFVTPDLYTYRSFTKCDVSGLSLANKRIRVDLDMCILNIMWWDICKPAFKVVNSSLNYQHVPGPSILAWDWVFKKQDESRTLFYNLN